MEQSGYTTVLRKDVKKWYITKLRIAISDYYVKKRGTWLFYPMAYSKPHFMNRTVHEIWELIDHRSEEEIVQILKEKYKTISEERLAKDVNQTIAYF